MSQVRINTTAVFSGGFVLPNSDSGFPANPRIGQFFTKDFQLYAYLRIGDLQTWYPLAARTRSFVHSQAQASSSWLVQHNLGSSDVWFTAYSASGIEIVNKESIDANSFRLHFDEPLSGTVVVVAPDSISVPTVTAGRIEAGNVVITTDGITIDGVAVLTEQSLAAQIGASVAAATEGKVDLAALTAESAARVAGDAANAAALSAEVARAQFAEAALATAAQQEAQTRAAADTAAAQALASEISRAQTAESALSSSIAVVSQAVSDEADRAQAAEAALNTAVLARATIADLDAAVGALENSDAILKSSIQSLTSAVATKASQIDFAAEVSRALAADAANAQAIADEVAARTAAVAAEQARAQAVEALKADTADLASVALSGSYADLSGKPINVSHFLNDLNYQTGAQVEARVQSVIGAAPAALDTLQEIAAQLALDQGAVSSLTTLLSTKASQASLDAEVLARQVADTALGSEIATKTTAAQAAAAAPVQSVNGKAGAVSVSLPMRSRAGALINVALAA
jgi:hypothetical protein